MLSNPKDLHFNTAIRVTDAVSDGTSLYTTNSTPQFRKYDLKTLNQTNTSLTVVGTPAGITMITAATAVIVSSGSNQVDFINVNTNDRTAVTSSATTVFGSNNATQQVDADPTQGVALATRSTSGGVAKITSGQVLSSLTPGGLSGVTTTCVTLASAGGNWLFGANNGNVYEINAAGTIIKTLSLPTTPNISAPTIRVTGISFYNDNLLVATNQGFLYHYQYNTSTVKGTYLIPSAVSTTEGTTLCRSASGFTIMGNTLQGASTGPSSATELFFDCSRVIFKPFYLETNNKINGVGLDSTGKAWCLQNTTTSVTFQLRLFDAGPFAKVMVPAEIQDPPGTIITGRVLRIRTDGIGRTCVESVTTVPNVTTNIPAIDGHDYKELIFNLAGTKWDLRDFSA